MKYKLDMSKMKDSQNRLRTLSLVFEHSKDKDCALFTIDHEDRVIGDKTYFSLQKLYIAASDPAEYTFAINTFGSYQLWERLRENLVMKEKVDKWRDELEVKIRSEAILQIKKNSKEGIKGQPAAKYLADGGWVTHSKPKKAEMKEKVYDELTDIEDTLGFNIEQPRKH